MPSPVREAYNNAKQLVLGPVHRHNANSALRGVARTQAAVAEIEHNPDAYSQIVNKWMNSTVTEEFGYELTRVLAEGDTVVHLARLATKTLLDGTITTSNGPMRAPGRIPDDKQGGLPSPLAGRTVSDRLVMRFARTLEGKPDPIAIGFTFSGTVINKQGVTHEGQDRGEVGTIVPIFDTDGFGGRVIRDHTGLQATHVAISSQAFQAPRHTDFGEPPAGVIEIRTEGALAKGAEVIFTPYNISTESVAVAAVQGLMNTLGGEETPEANGTPVEAPPQYVDQLVVRPLAISYTAGEVLNAVGPMPLLSAAVERRIDSPSLLTGTVELFATPFETPSPTRVTTDRNATYREMPQLQLIDPTRLAPPS